MASQRQYKSCKAETRLPRVYTQDTRRSQSGVSGGDLVARMLWVDMRAGPHSCLKALVKVWIWLCLKWKGRRGRHTILFKLLSWLLCGSRMEQGQTWRSGGQIRSYHNTSERWWRLWWGWRQVRWGEAIPFWLYLKVDSARVSPIFSVISPILLILGFTKCCLRGPFSLSQPQIQSVSKYCLWVCFRVSWEGI